MTEPLRADVPLSQLPAVLAGLLEKVESLEAQIRELQAQPRGPLDGWVQVRELAARTGIPMGTLRGWLLDREINGLGAHVREGRPLYVHEQGFRVWWEGRG